VSVSRDFRKAVVLADGWNLGLQYQVIDLQTLGAETIGGRYDGVHAFYPTRRIEYAAGDGLRIPAYLTTPRRHDAKAPALVVLVHGGPAARDTAHFDWWAQALADQGYAVLRANFRGSSVSAELMAAGDGQYGRRMQTDLSDGVRYLAGEGLIDPARVCIVGASYGGYAALAGVSLESRIYRCAVSVAGLSDLRAHQAWISDRYRSGDGVELRNWNRLLGVSGPEDPLLDSLSPIRHVDAVTVPVLLIHGKDDTVVPFEQSDDMFDALRGAGKTVQFVKLRHEDHWLSKPDTRQQMLDATVAFLRRYNPPE